MIKPTFVLFNHVNLVRKNYTYNKYQSDEEFSRSWYKYADYTFNTH